MDTLRHVDTEHRTTRSAGFTFVEVLIAMALMTILLLAAAPMMMLSTRQVAASREVTQLTLAAKDKMEELRYVDFDTDVVLGSITADVTDYMDEPAENLKRRWSITPQNAGTQRTYLIQVQVASARNDLLSAGRELVLETSVF